MIKFTEHFYLIQKNQDFQNHSPIPLKVFYSHLCPLQIKALLYFTSNTIYTSMQPQHISTRYTQIPIVDPSHQAKLQAYMAQPAQPKTSFCRFYLRGLCIMKPECCKFAHKFEGIDLSEDEWELIKTSSYDQKQRKKLYFQAKQDFQQKPLFFIKNLDYLILYQYQFQEKWKQSPKFKKFHTVEEIREDRELRHKIREVLHRQNWSKLIDYLIQTFPKVDFSISFMSKWFSKIGFQKPQTRCKFGDFMRYMVAVKHFKQVNIMMPPRLQKTVFFINCGQTGQNTHMFQNILQIEQLHLQAKQEYKKQMLIRLQPLAQRLSKRFMCRYFMAGNCQYTQEECKYAHCIEVLRFEVNQVFEPRHKQVAKGRQQRLNYVSLHRYSQTKINNQTTLQQLNANSNLRQQYRKIMHHQLYSHFLLKLQYLTNSQHFKKSFIQQQYNGAGFNHSQQNKFGQFEGSLFEIGYVVEDLKLEGDKGPKCSYVYKIPKVEELDEYFAKQINEILEEEVNAIKKAESISKKVQNVIFQCSETQKIQSSQTATQHPSLSQPPSPQHQQQPRQVILQSSFRKKLYHLQQPFTVPLHVYLRLKSLTLQQTIKQLTLNKSLLSHIFFQTNQQNYKKLIDLCKQYFKNSSKQYIHKLDEIELFIKSLHKEQINLNSNVTLKAFLQPALIDAGKKVYSLKFGSNTFVIDRGNLPGHEKAIIKGKYQLKNYLTSDQTILNKLNQNSLTQERIIIVENQSSFDYAQMFLSNCNKLGIDLQGRLKKDGYIDLIQVSSIFNNKKHIFVFDIFVVKKMEDQGLYHKIVKFLKLLFEDPYRVKILHDCKQDSTALKYLMGIELKNVFDTSGMNMILQQKQIYQKWQKKHQTTHHILKKTYQVKVPGLNTVLQKWGAPNGVNIFKQSMKKRFHQDGPRSYFQQRPIDLQFLQYSAQDVEDLIQVYEAMKKEDTDRLAEVVGEIYSLAWMGNQ